MIRSFVRYILDNKISFLMCCIFIFASEIALFFYFCPKRPLYIKAQKEPIMYSRDFGNAERVIMVVFTLVKLPQDAIFIGPADFFDLCEFINHKLIPKDATPGWGVVNFIILETLYICMVMVLVVLALVFIPLYDLSIIFFLVGIVLGYWIGYHGVGYICKVFGMKWFQQAYVRNFSLYAIVAPFYAFYLRFVVINFLWYFIIFPIVYLISIIQYRHLAFPNMEGIKIMKENKGKKNNDTEKEMKEFGEIQIPDVLSIQPKNYREYLATKRGLKRTGKTIGAQKQVLEQVQDYFSTATAAKRSKFEFDNLEDEQEVARIELETRKIEALNRQKLASSGYAVDQREQEAKEVEALVRKLKAVAEIEELQKRDTPKDELDGWLKEAETIDAKEEWFDMKVQEIKEKYRDDPERAEERIDNLDRRLNEQGFWEGSDRDAGRGK